MCVCVCVCVIAHIKCRRLVLNLTRAQLDFGTLPCYKTPGDFWVKYATNSDQNQVSETDHLNIGQPSSRLKKMFYWRLFVITRRFNNLCRHIVFSRVLIKYIAFKLRKRRNDKHLSNAIIAILFRLVAP